MAGYEVFKAKCANCHQEPLFTDYSFKNNGLAITTDEGRAQISQNIDDFSKFKVPTLRNVLHTAPYMHDGRFIDIEEVLEHYKNGIIQSSTLAPSLQNGIQLSSVEQTNLIFFLETLTDNELRNNPKFQE